MNNALFYYLGMTDRPYRYRIKYTSITLGL